MGPSSDAGRVAALVGLRFGLAGMGSAAVAVTLPAIAVDLGLTTGGVSWAILGLDRSLLLLAALPLAGCLALVGTLRGGAGRGLIGPGIPRARRPG